MKSPVLIEADGSIGDVVSTPGRAQGSLTRRRANRINPFGKSEVKVGRRDFRGRGKSLKNVGKKAQETFLQLFVWLHCQIH